MQVYLPIAEMSVNAFLLLGMGSAVGFLSGMFGVGGGFLMTPLLIFAGVPPTVAVATSLDQLVASSFSGAIAHWRRRTVDFKMAAVLLVGGLFGSLFGIGIFDRLAELGQADLLIALSYVAFLGSVGALMLIESLAVMRRAGRPRRATGLGHHSWIHGLPFKMRFRSSKLYISAIPPILVGFAVGVLAAIMGVGGGFVIVPAMIYILRMPTNVVVGTSLVQIMVLSAFNTILHAVSYQTVDVFLALFLIVGGVVGVQFGVRIGVKLRGEQLRALLAILVLGTGLRLAADLVIEPKDPFSIILGEGP